MQTDSAKLLLSIFVLFFVELNLIVMLVSFMGSARETFSFEDMKDVSIPIPNLEIQKSIVRYTKHI